MRAKLCGFLLFTLVLATLWACSGGGGGGGGEAPDNPVPPALSLTNNNIDLLANAPQDECYVRYSGDLYNTATRQLTGVQPTPLPPATPVNGVCPANPNNELPNIPKANEAYVWGLARTGGNELWLGTGANVMCLVEGTYDLTSLRPSQGTMDDGVTLQQVCEFGSSWVTKEFDGKDPQLPAAVPAEVGDWRPPTIYRYPLPNGPLTAVTIPDSSPDAQTLLKNTLGLRSAGSIGNIVFLAGPGMPTIAGPPVLPGDPDEGSTVSNTAINVFAFNATTGAFIDALALEGYSSVRKWRTLYGELYTAVTVSAEVSAADTTPGGPYYGRVLKWVGTEADPFNRLTPGTDPFAEVGILPGGGAELSEYGKNRIAVATWPGGIEGAASGALQPGTLADVLKHGGIYISVPVPGAGLSPASAATNFTEAFSFSQYDLDFVRAYSYGGGALAYFDGWLVWGTMHVPGTSRQGIDLVYSQSGLVTSNSSCREIINPDQDPNTPGSQRICPNSDSSVAVGEYAWNVCSAGTPATADCTYSRDICLQGLRQSLLDTGTPENVTKVAEYDACVVEAEAYSEASATPAISIFRGRNLEDPVKREIAVLYGYDTMPVGYFNNALERLALQDSFTTPVDRDWVATANGVGVPLFGRPGIGPVPPECTDAVPDIDPAAVCYSLGNPQNNYTWEMGIVNNRLYVGTMDQTSIFSDTDPEAGADLYSFASPKQAAVRENGNGLNNTLNYGFRTLLTDEATNSLFIGTANPFNLAPNGGWELLELTVQ